MGKKTVWLFLFLFLVVPDLLQAATFTVTKTADTNDGACDADCSLREAIVAANVATDADTINLPAGTYTLTITGRDEDFAATGDLDIRADVTLAGAGAGTTIIDGGGIDRVLATVVGGLAITISDVTIQNGSVPTGGGAGAGMSAFGTFTLNNVVITNNTVNGTALGDIGGGIITGGSGTTLTINNSTISGNSADRGGGIFAQLSGTLVIEGSTLSGNSAREAGGIETFSTTTITNSTISGNTADEGAGGLFQGDVTTLVNVTITGNTADNDNNGTGNGGGILSSGNLNLKHTIIAGNTDRGGEGPDCFGTVTSQDFNLVEDTTGCTIVGVTTNDITGADPTLGSLADNGGPTLTHALLAGSSAIDAGDPGGCTEAGGSSLETDQRGLARPADGNNDGTETCDIGAYEKGICGDGFQEPEEECDDGNTSDDGNGCSTACLNNAVCGDGTVQSIVEECDDGNAVDGDGCSASCQEEAATGNEENGGGGCSLIPSR